MEDLKENQKMKQAGAAWFTTSMHKVHQMVGGQVGINELNVLLFEDELPPSVGEDAHPILLRKLSPNPIKVIMKNEKTKVKEEI